MITTKRLAEMTRKWRRMATRGSKRISHGDDSQSTGCDAAAPAAPVPNRGHFVAYAADGKRFVLPLSYLHRPIVRELLRMAEEEFGLRIGGAITLPCDAGFIDYVMSLLRRDVPKEIENALVVSLAGCSSRCWSSSTVTTLAPGRITNHGRFIHGY